MSGSIRLHPKHGLNPTMPVCFCCGQDTGEIALLGAAYKGEAPHRMVMDKAPCKKCQDLMTRGVILIETRDGEEGENPYRTGYMTVVTVEAARNIFNKNIDLEKNRVFFIEERVLKTMMGDLYRVEKEKE